MCDLCKEKELQRKELHGGVPPPLRKKSCRPGWSGSPGNHLVGCINGRPVDSPLSAQPPGTVNLRHVTTSFR
jgi:hypothetical protein